MKMRSQNFRFEQNVFEVPFRHPQCKKIPREKIRDLNHW